MSPVQVVESGDWDPVQLLDEAGMVLQRTASKRESDALVADGSDRSLSYIKNDALDFNNSLQMHSPTSVRDYDGSPRVAKRIKICGDKEKQQLRSQTIKRQSWRKPVCTFLNYYGSRMAQIQIAAPSLKYDTDSTSLSTTLALFPICPCKLRHQVLKGSLRTAPPILELLSVANVCHPIILQEAHQEALPSYPCADLESSNKSQYKGAPLMETVGENVLRQGTV